MRLRTAHKRAAKKLRAAITAKREVFENKVSSFFGEYDSLSKPLHFWIDHRPTPPLDFCAGYSWSWSSRPRYTARNGDLTALINKREVVYNFCSANRNSFDKLEKAGKVLYIGRGYYLGTPVERGENLRLLQRAIRKAKRI